MVDEIENNHVRKILEYERQWKELVNASNQHIWWCGSARHIRQIALCVNKRPEGALSNAFNWRDTRKFVLSIMKAERWSFEALNSDAWTSTPIDLDAQIRNP